MSDPRREPVPGELFAAAYLPCEVGAVFAAYELLQAAEPGVPEGSPHAARLRRLAEELRGAGPQVVRWVQDVERRLTEAGVGALPERPFDYAGFVGWSADVGDLLGELAPGGAAADHVELGVALGGVVQTLAIAGVLASLAEIDARAPFVKEHTGTIGARLADGRAHLRRALAGEGLPVEARRAARHALTLVILTPRPDSGLARQLGPLLARLRGVVDQLWDLLGASRESDGPN